MYKIFYYFCLCNYRNTFLHEPLEDRKKHLYKQYGFECDCAACVNNYPTQKPNRDTKIGDVLLGTEILQDFDKNWREVEDCFKRKHNYRIAQLIAQNKILLEDFVSRNFL